ncbi:DNA helicase [Handroanthus impetiginosus]|uniref:DNA helicase n=1 Tax=Handroanthus impetiginosus TaxID=429701 RepID=A0A2G9HSN2_9LAMI|nr:DNA helicase [Handroanthus impetiginosus]
MASIYRSLSINPAKQENYVVFCHSHLIRTVVTANPSVVRKWVQRTRCYNHYLLSLGRRLVVGLGVQWSPGGSSPAATLQLCVHNHCLIFQLLHATSYPAELRHFLSDPNVIFVGFWNYRDTDLLENSHYHLRVSRLVECATWRASIEALAEEVLGIDGLKKEKAVGRSKWDERWLTKEQVEYACIDVLFSLLMAKALRVW